MTNKQEEYGGSFCKCPPKDKHGQTAVMCCNHCGMPDEPFWQPPTDAVGEEDEMWQELIHEVEQHQKRQTEYPDVINELKSQYKLIKK